MERIICLIIGYAFGLFQTGYLVGKLNHIDIRQKGSGNSGSTNALRVLGVKAGLMTFAGDVLKCVFAIFLVRLIFADSTNLPLLAMYTGAGVTLGHNYPFYLHFQGGKGIAVLAGLILSTKLWMAPIPLLAFVLVVAVTRYVSAGSLLVTVIFLAEVIFCGQTGGFGMSHGDLLELYILTGVLMALAWWRHRANIGRLIHGTENKIGSSKKRSMQTEK